MTVRRIRPLLSANGGPGIPAPRTRPTNETEMIVRQPYLASSARVHPLLADSCRCRGSGACMACRRWSRHYADVAERCVHWAAHEGHGR